MDTVDDLQASLMQLLDSLGKYTMQPKKESIHVVRRRTFLAIHPRKSYLGVNVVLHRVKASPQANKIEQISANRFHHFYKITNKKELNNSFTRLLREAYNLAQPKE
jgi:hypothetical protein